MRHTHSLLAVVRARCGPRHGTRRTSHRHGQDQVRPERHPTVAIGQYDPITNHNGTGAAHEHQFFGNTAWHALPNPNTANYADLVGKQNNCRNVLGLPYSADSAGYWTPTLRYKAGTPKAGQLIAGRQFTAYFRGYNGQTFGPGMAFPADTRLIASDDYGKGAHGWNCGQFSAQAQRDGTVNYIPTAPASRAVPGAH